MKSILNEILNYINQNYEVTAELKPRFLYENNIYIKAKKYDLDIGIGKPSEKHFLYGQSEYYLSFNYDANKKYRSELCCHGGGYNTKYEKNNYEHIDEFLKRFCERKQFKQMDIFEV